jgi:isoquinoline 1-oxidoreductase
VAEQAGISRRAWLGAVGGGVAFDVTVQGEGRPLLGARFEFAADGSVTLLTGKCELGQGSRTLLAQCVAEELRLPIEKIQVVMADTGRVPDDGGTYASLTTPLAVPAVRQAAAAARDALRTMKPEEAARREVALDVVLSSPQIWKVLGSPVPNLNGRAIVTGRMRYAGDLVEPGMLHGKLVRPAAYHAELVSYKAEPTPGVQVVREGNVLGAVAASEDAAESAVAQIAAEWKSRDLIPPADLPAHFRKTAVEPKVNNNSRYPPLLIKGSVESALAGAARTHQATYRLPAIAHAPIEPRAAIAHWDEHGLTVRSCGQVPFGVRKQLAAAFRIPESRVRVILSDTGSACGGKHGPEVLIEAAALAKAAGKPVRVAWSREEEFVRSYCRPPALVDVQSGLSADGRIVAWEFRNYNSGAAGLAAPYDIPHYRCAHYRAECPLRLGPYRSLAAVANTFARESHVDELAALHGDDPLEFRLRNIANPRLKEALQRAATRFGWGKGKRAVGLACNIEKGGHLALFVEIEVAKRVRLVRMTAAFDCGAILNPDGLRNQVEGAIVMGIGGALFEEFQFDRHKALNPSFSAYRVPRFSDAAPLEVILIDRREETPAGAGESPITATAPAIASALFRATGKRLRDLPLERGLA